MTAPTWTAEREITLSHARRLIREFPGLADASVEPFAQGWDNSAFLVSRSGSENLVFRFPRRAMALPGIRRELAWLPVLAPLLPVLIPVPSLQGSWAPDQAGDEPAEGADPWPFWGAELLPGDELALNGPAAMERLAPARQLGAFLHVLHSVEPAELNADPGAALLVDPMNRGHPAERAADTLACLDRLARAGVEGPQDGVAALIDRAAQLPAPAAPGVICHGDLHVRHVLLSPATDGAWRLSGVIDWGDLCLGDPAIDLSIAFAAFSGAARREFFTQYGPIDSNRELRARALAVRLSALLTEYALAHVGREGALSHLLPEVSAGMWRALEA